MLLLLAALTPKAIAAEPKAGAKDMSASKHEEQTTIRDHLWVWGHDASFDWPAHEDGESPGKNRMTPVEGAARRRTPSPPISWNISASWGLNG